MGEKIQLKVCGMRELENIHSLIENASPDWMGLIFYEKSPRYIGKAGNEISQLTNVQKVGVFVNESIDFVLNKVQEYQLSAIQLHGSEDFDYISSLRKNCECQIFKTFSISTEVQWDEVLKYQEVVDVFLFDTATPQFGGSGKRFDWNLLLSYPSAKPFLLSGGIDFNHLQEIVQLKNRFPQLLGVDINSKFEISYGLKDIEKIARFKHLLEQNYNSSLL
jgi:phosphoribosylanthranilate isomerase